MPLKSAQLVLAMPGPGTGAMAFSPGNSRHGNLASVTGVNLPDPGGITPRRTAACRDGTGSLRALLAAAGSARHAANPHLLLERGAVAAMRDERGQDAANIASAAGPTAIAA